MFEYQRKMPLIIFPHLNFLAVEVSHMFNACVLCGWSSGEEPATCYLKVAVSKFSILPKCPSARCRDSKTHNNHRFRPIDDAAQDLKVELQKSLKPLQDKLKHFKL